MQHSNLPPVIDVFYFRGQPVNVHRAPGGTMGEAVAALGKTMLPQNNATLKVTKRTIVENAEKAGA